PASGQVNPVEINYSTDLISYPQILFNSKPASLDLVWTEYSEIDSIGYIYYLNLPLTEVAPTYAFDMGQETPVPVLVQRDGYIVYGLEDYKTVDYDSTELVYHLALHSPHTKYKIRWTYYHEELNKLKLQFNIDDILHRNRWVNPGEKIIEEAWIPQSCLQDNEITIKIKRLSGTIAVLSGIEIYTEEVGGGGPCGTEVHISRPFYLERIYPNPAKGMIHLRFNSPDTRKISIKIYDVSGRLVHKESIIKSKIGMNEVLLIPDGLSAGVYFVRLETEGYEKIEKAVLLR
ncbi:MAG: T9SS type A sorting domain-containing protein, partial [bacterium]